MEKKLKKTRKMFFPPACRNADGDFYYQRPTRIRSASAFGKPAVLILSEAVFTSYSARIFSYCHVAVSKIPKLARQSLSRGCPMLPILTMHRFPSVTSRTQRSSQNTPGPWECPTKQRGCVKYAKFNCASAAER